MSNPERNTTLIDALQEPEIVAILNEVVEGGSGFSGDMDDIPDGTTYVKTENNLTDALVSGLHSQGTDQGLDTGGANAVTAAQAKAGYTHSGVAHAPSGAQANADITKGEIEAKLTGAITSHSHASLYVVTWHANATSAFTMTNATLAERFAGNSTRHVLKVDLTGYSQVRMMALCTSGSASANTPLFRFRYYTSFSGTVSDYLQLGASSQVEASVTASGYKDTDWINLAAGAKTNVFIAAMELGGDGAADPAMGNTYIMFR